MIWGDDALIYINETNLWLKYWKASALFTSSTYPAAALKECAQAMLYLSRAL